MEFDSQWGILPQEAKQIIERREWGSLNTIKKRMTGEKPFPVRLPLKPPNGQQALSNMRHLQAFIRKWREYPYQEYIQYEERQFRTVGKQRIPKSLELKSFKQLLEFIGPEAIDKAKAWESKISPLLTIDDRLSKACIQHLDTLEKTSLDDIRLLSEVLSQLKFGMGEGLFMRALPIKGLHTKFLEEHEKLITACLDILHENSVSDAGGLGDWLRCTPKPTGWLLMRALSPEIKRLMGGFDVLKLSQQELSRYEFPVDNVLVIENEPPGFALPEIENAISVFGGGANVSWMSSVDLKNKQVLYWGDIDSYGFKYLGDARNLCPHTKAVLMDSEVVFNFDCRMVPDTLYTGEVNGLTPEEHQLFQDLQKDVYSGSRLEQELIDQDYVVSELSRYLKIN